MKTIKLNQPKGSNYGPQIIELERILTAVNKLPTTTVVFDFSKITFVRPLFILTLCGLFQFLKRNGVKVFCKNADIDYLKVIQFNEGFRPDFQKNWEGLLMKHSSKNYLPILNFPTSKKPDDVQIRNDSLSCLNRIIQRKLKLDHNCFNAISYLISEMTDNISDHSGEDRGWLFAQFYPGEGFIDICILDTGKTILRSYIDSGFPVKSHRQAIEQATEGLSTKNDRERGKGIPTSRRLIVNGMKGKFGLVSGDGLLQNDKIIQLPFEWPGTFLALRIPQNAPDFNLYDYLE